MRSLHSRFCLLIYFLRMSIAFTEIAPAGHHPMVHQKLNHLALISAFTALKSSCGTRLSGKVEPSKLGLREFRLLHQFGGTHRTHDIKMFRNDEGDLQFSFESFLDTSIRCDATLEDNGGQDLFPSADIIQIILHQGVAKASHDILNRMSDLLFVNHVGFGKDRASSRDPHGVTGFESEIPKGVDGDPKPGGLLIQKRACAGGSDRIHGKIHHNAVSQHDDLRILATDFDDGLCLREKVNHCDGMGSNLILNKIGPNQICS